MLPLATLPLLAVAALIALGGRKDVVVSNSEEKPPPVEPSAGALLMTLPPGWGQAARPARIPDLKLSDPVAYSQQALDVRLVAGLAPPESPTLLPAAFARRFKLSLEDAERVRFAGKLRGFHYAGVVDPKIDSIVDVFAAPTTDGIATLACVAPALVAVGLEDCRAIASSILVPDAEPLALSRHSAFWLRLHGLVRDLDAARRQARSAQGGVAGQAQASRRLGDAFAGAADALRPLVGSPSRGTDAFLSALTRVAAAYRGLAGGLERQSRAQIAAGQSGVTRGEKRLRALLREAPN